MGKTEFDSCCLKDQAVYTHASACLTDEICGKFSAIDQLPLSAFVQGIIEVGRQKLTIVDLEALREMTEVTLPTTTRSDIGVGF